MGPGMDPTSLKRQDWSPTARERSLRSTARMQAIICGDIARKIMKTIRNVMMQ